MSQINFSTDIIDLQDKDLIIVAVTTQENFKIFHVSKPREKSNFLVFIVVVLTLRLMVITLDRFDFSMWEVLKQELVTNNGDLNAWIARKHLMNLLLWSIRVQPFPINQKYPY